MTILAPSQTVGAGGKRGPAGEAAVVTGRQRSCRRLLAGLGLGLSGHPPPQQACTWGCCEDSTRPWRQAGVTSQPRGPAPPPPKRALLQLQQLPRQVDLSCPSKHPLPCLEPGGAKNAWAQPRKTNTMLPLPVHRQAQGCRVSASGQPRPGSVCLSSWGLSATHHRDQSLPKVEKTNRRGETLREDKSPG